MTGLNFERRASNGGPTLLGTSLPRHDAWLPGWAGLHPFCRTLQPHHKSFLACSLVNLPSTTLIALVLRIAKMADSLLAFFTLMDNQNGTIVRGTSSSHLRPAAPIPKNGHQVNPAVD